MINQKIKESIGDVISMMNLKMLRKFFQFHLHLINMISEEVKLEEQVKDGGHLVTKKRMLQVKPIQKEQLVVSKVS